MQKMIGNILCLFKKIILIFSWNKKKYIKTSILKRKFYSSLFKMIYVILDFNYAVEQRRRGAIIVVSR